MGGEAVSCIWWSEAIYSSPVLWVPRRGVHFELYTVAKEDVIGAVLTQETEEKGYIIIYASRRSLDAKMRYIYENLCLS